MCPEGTRSPAKAGGIHSRRDYAPRAPSTLLILRPETSVNAASEAGSEGSGAVGWPGDRVRSVRAWGVTAGRPSVPRPCARCRPAKRNAFFLPKSSPQALLSREQFDVVIFLLPELTSFKANRKSEHGTGKRELKSWQGTPRDRSGIGRVGSPQPIPGSVVPCAQWARSKYLLNEPMHPNAIIVAC